MYQWGFNTIIDVVALKMNVSNGQMENVNIATVPKLSHPIVEPQDGVVLQRLIALLPGEFELLVWRLRVPRHLLSSSTAPQTTRALELLQFLAAAGRVAELERAIADVRASDITEHLDVKVLEVSVSGRCTFTARHAILILLIGTSGLLGVLAYLWPDKPSSATRIERRACDED
jgi:hypothetical protein